MRDKIVRLGNRFEFGRHHLGPDVGAFIWVVTDEFGDPIDIVAWPPGGDPMTWIGRAAMLGEDQLFEPRLDDPALHVHADVLAWLRSGRRGVVIMNPTRAASQLREAGPLVVSTAAHRKRLEALLTVRPPRIEVSAHVAPLLPHLEAAE